MSATGGRIPFVSFAELDPATRSWKTSQGSSLGDTGTSEPFSGTWPRAGTMRSGRASPQPPSKHPTDGIDSGSSPLATTECFLLEPLATSLGETPHGGWPWPNLLGALLNHPTGRSGLGLELQEGVVSTELQGADPNSLAPKIQTQFPTSAIGVAWPTPTASDAVGGAGCSGRDGGPNLRTAVAWPTPLVRDYKGADYGRGSRGRHAGVDLATAVDKRTCWPTPMAGPIHAQDGGGHGGVKLAEVATEAEVGPDVPRGQLNPDWVELLMGWPQGWTNTDPMSRSEFDAWTDGFCLHLDGEGPRTWGDGSWEAGVARIGTDIPNRVSRLKAIGNGQVPLCAAWAALCLFEMARQLEEAVCQARVPKELDLLGGP